MTGFESMWRFKSRALLFNITENINEEEVDVRNHVDAQDRVSNALPGTVGAWTI